MITIEQVQLLEEKVDKTISYVERITEDNVNLRSENALLKSKMDTYQKRIDELEVHVMRFKDDHGRIEDGIIAALGRLSQFEEAFETSLKDEKISGKKTSAKKDKTPASDSQEFFEITDTVNLEESEEPSIKKNKKSTKPDNDNDEEDGLDIF